MSRERCCYWCGGARDPDVNYRLKLAGDSERPVCKDCLREWPPDD